MAFPVAVQSAIFYILACTPCMAARTRYRTRQQSRREREERARQDADDPQLYRQPSPFNVNPFWEEEIQMGPSLPKKGAKPACSKNPSQRKLTSAGKDSSTGTRSSMAASRAPPAGGAPHDSPTPAADDSASVSDSWNHKRYQREDEELWGHEQSRTHKLMDAIVKAGSSAGRLIESRLGKDKHVITDRDRANFYAAPIHPPVNDYHPPVVSSKPAHKDALKWMLQPPPPAKVMEGKVPVSRTTSTASSIGRRTAAGSDVSLGRMMSERRMEARLRAAESGPADAADNRLPLPSPDRSASRRSAGPPPARSHRSRRSDSLSTESEESSDSIPRPRRRRATPQPQPPTPEVDSGRRRARQPLEQQQPGRQARHRRHPRRPAAQAGHHLQLRRQQSRRPAGGAARQEGECAAARRRRCPARPRRQLRPQPGQRRAADGAVH